MSEIMHPDLSRIIQLPLPDQLQAVEDLWDHISGSSQPLPVPDWQRRELDKRRAGFEQAPESAIPWEDALKQLRKP
ncbi:MAG: addiction module protein [Planctomycetaceae bacterium]